MNPSEMTPLEIVNHYTRGRTQNLRSGDLSSDHSAGEENDDDDVAGISGSIGRAMNAIRGGDFIDADEFMRECEERDPSPKEKKAGSSSSSSEFNGPSQPTPADSSTRILPRSSEKSSARAQKSSDKTKSGVKGISKVRKATKKKDDSLSKRDAERRADRKSSKSPVMGADGKKSASRQSSSHAQVREATSKKPSSSEAASPEIASRKTSPKPLRKALAPVIGQRVNVTGVANPPVSRSEARRQPVHPTPSSAPIDAPSTKKHSVGKRASPSSLDTHAAKKHRSREDSRPQPRSMDQSEKDQGRTRTGVMGEPPSAVNPKRLTGLRSAPAVAPSADGGESSADRELRAQNRNLKFYFQRFEDAKAGWEHSWNEKPVNKDFFEWISKQVVEDLLNLAQAQEGAVLRQGDSMGNKKHIDKRALEKARGKVSNTYLYLTQTVIPKIRHQLGVIGRDSDLSFLKMALRKAELRRLGVSVLSKEKETRMCSDLRKSINDQIAGKNGSGDAAVALTGRGLSAVRHIVQVQDNFRRLLNVLEPERNT